VRMRSVRREESLTGSDQREMVSRQPAENKAGCHYRNGHGTIAI
jgi:hypothetical protein